MQDYKSYKSDLDIDFFSLICMLINLVRKRTKGIFRVKYCSVLRCQELVLAFESTKCSQTEE